MTRTPEVSCDNCVFWEDETIEPEERLNRMLTCELYSEVGRCFIKIYLYRKGGKESKATILEYSPLKAGRGKVKSSGSECSQEKSPKSGL